MWHSFKFAYSGGDAIFEGKLTDENGNDNGTSGNHGDIAGYKIKIQESANTSFNTEEEYFKDFDILTVDNSNNESEVCGEHDGG